MNLEELLDFLESYHLPEFEIESEKISNYVKTGLENMQKEIDRIAKIQSDLFRINKAYHNNNLKLQKELIERLENEI